MHYNEFYKTLISKLELPEEAEKEFTDVVKLADENLQFGRELDKLIMRFMFPKAHDIRRFMEKLSPVSQKYSVSETTLQFVFLLLSAELLYKRYQKQNIPDGIFYDTIKDLKYKFYESVFLTHTNLLHNHKV